MNRKILLLITLLGIFALLILNNQQTKPMAGTISKISYNKNVIYLNLEGIEEPIVVFTNTRLNIKEKDEIIIEGREEEYQMQKQILADKIIKIN